MNVTSLLTLIRREIGDENGDRFSDASLLSDLNLIYRNFCAMTKIVRYQDDFIVSAYQTHLDLTAANTDYEFIEYDQFFWGRTGELYPHTTREMDYDYSNWVGAVGSPRELVFGNWGYARIHPIPSGAGTVIVRGAIMPPDLTTSSSTYQLASTTSASASIRQTYRLKQNDTPVIPLVYHRALVDGVAALAYAQMREYDNMARAWARYKTKRDEAAAKQRQKTPDTFISQKPLDHFDQELWAGGFRRT